MPVRDGRQFIEGLKARPREVWLDGERVQDVTEHPALKSSVRQLARLYDMQSDPHHRDILTYTSPSSGDAVGTSFMAAEDQEGLFKRRQGVPPVGRGDLRHDGPGARFHEHHAFVLRRGAPGVRPRRRALR